MFFSGSIKITRSISVLWKSRGLNKNPLAIARALKTEWEKGQKSASIVKLVEDVVDFARESR
jgi:uncharacterized protein YfeS